MTQFELEVLGHFETLELVATCCIYLLGLIAGGISWLVVIKAKDSSRYW